jgi:two-component system, chemotaxis family, chemotaxis protein CheY
MICDDARFMLMVIERLFNKLGHEVVHRAINGEEAIEKYMQHWSEIDLITLDVVMPKLDGIRVLKRILSINPNAKIIMVTSISNRHIVDGALKLGAKDFVTKPFRLSEFVSVINRVLMSS